MLALAEQLGAGDRTAEHLADLEQADAGVAVRCVVGDDLEQAEAVNARDATAARANFDHVDRWNCDGQSAALLEAPPPIDFKKPGD